MRISIPRNPGRYVACGKVKGHWNIYSELLTLQCQHFYELITEQQLTLSAFILTNFEDRAKGPFYGLKDNFTSFIT